MKWRRRRSERDEAVGFPSQPHRQNVSHWARSCRSAQLPAAQTQCHSPLMQKMSLQQPRPAANDHNPGSYGCPVSEMLTPLSIQSSSIVANPSSKQLSSRGAKTYAEVVRQRPDSREELMDTWGMQPTQHLKRLDHPVDLTGEGCCLRCLGRGHAVRECRDPSACRLYRLPGH